MEDRRLRLLLHESNARVLLFSTEELLGDLTFSIPGSAVLSIQREDQGIDWPEKKSGDLTRPKLRS